MKYLIVAGSLMLGGISAGADAPEDLQWKNYREIRDYVVGDDTDRRYLKVDWKETVLDGQVAGAKEDRPILLWLYFGGPLGNC